VWAESSSGLSVTTPSSLGGRRSAQVLYEARPAAPALGPARNRNAANAALTTVVYPGPVSRAFLPISQVVRAAAGAWLCRRGAEAGASRLLFRRRPLGRSGPTWSPSSARCRLSISSAGCRRARSPPPLNSNASQCPLPPPPPVMQRATAARPSMTNHFDLPGGRTRPDRRTNNPDGGASAHAGEDEHGGAFADGARAQRPIRPPRDRHPPPRRLHAATARAGSDGKGIAPWRSQGGWRVGASASGSGAGRQCRGRKYVDAGDGAPCRR